MMYGLSAPVVGPSNHTIDPDGRLIIPQRIRGLLGSNFVLTRGVEKCLWMLPEHFFTSLIQKWTTDMSLLDRDARMLDWRFIGQAVQLQPDKQFRVVIPAELRESAGIKSDVIALGMLNRVELWDLATWREYEAGLDAETVQNALNRKLRIQSAAAEPAE